MIGLLVTLRKVVFISDFQYGFRSSCSTAVLLTVLSDRTVMLLISVGLLNLQYLIYSRLSAGFGMMVFFINSSLMEIQIGWLALFYLFSVLGSLEWLWMEILCKNIWLMLLLSKALFLFLRFPYYALMTFLMMLSVNVEIYASDTTLYSKCVKHLICGNSYTWLLN